MGMGGSEGAVCAVRVCDEFGRSAARARLSKQTAFEPGEPREKRGRDHSALLSLLPDPTFLSGAGRIGCRESRGRSLSGGRAQNGGIGEPDDGLGGRLERPKFT